MQLTRKPRVWLITSLLTLVFLLAASSGASPAGTTPAASHPKAPDSQQTYLSSDTPDTSVFDEIDPAQGGNLYAVSDLFVGLVELNDQGVVYCELCSTYSVAPDGLTWTFTLRPNLKFSDGTPLTSADVLYSLNRVLDPATQSVPGPSYLGFIKDASAYTTGSKTITTLIGDSLLAPDAQTVKIIAASPVVYFLDALTYPTSYVVERSVIKKWGKTWTNHLSDNGGQGGAGPWKMQQYAPSKQFVLVPNPNYWGPQPQLRKIVYRADPTYHAYLVNHSDDTSVSIADIDRARTRKDFHQVPEPWINYYAMNYSIKPFDVVACRQAFALAINKTLIVQSVWKNTLIPTNHIVPKGMYGYDANLKGPDGTASTSGNPTQARADLQTCMTAQSYRSLSQFPPITLTYSSGGAQAVRNETATLQQEWQSTLGITVTLKDIDFIKLLGEMSSGCSNTLQFYASGWIADYPDPSDFTTLQFDKGSPNNSMCYGQNKGPGAAEQQVQKALEAADFNSNPESRLAAYNQAEQALVNDVAWLPMDQKLQTFLRKPCVQGWTDTTSAPTPEDWSKIYISIDRPCAITS